MCKALRGSGKITHTRSYVFGTGPPTPQALQVAERPRSIQPRDPLNEINAAEQASKSWCHHIIYSPKSPSRFSQRKHSSTFPPVALQCANKSEAEVLLPGLRWDYKPLAPSTLLTAFKSEGAEATGGWWHWGSHPEKAKPAPFCKKLCARALHRFSSSSSSPPPWDVTPFPASFQAIVSLLSAFSEMEFVPQENKLQRKSSTVLVASQHQPNVTSQHSREWWGSNHGRPPPCLQRMGETGTAPALPTLRGAASTSKTP